MDVDLLREAGIEDADAVVVATDGDNTNIVIGQVAQKRFDIRLRRRARARPGAREFYAERGLRHRLPDDDRRSTALDARPCAACDDPRAAGAA